MPIGVIATVGAAVIGAGATMISSSNASHAQTHAADQAASIEQQNAAANNQLARDMHADAVARLDPYSSMGLAAGDEYMGLLLGDKGTHSGSGWAPTNALAPTAPATTPAPTAPSALHPVVAQQAQAAIAAGADPAAVAQRAAQYGVHF